MNKEKVDKGNQKKSPLDQFTRNQWALFCSRIRYGQIPTNIVIKDGAIDVIHASFPSRRQANKNRSKVASQILKDGKKLIGFRLVNA